MVTRGRAEPGAGAQGELSAHVLAALCAYGPDRVELEWRLGHRQGSFRPGVSAAAWAKLQAALDASPAFTREYRETREALGDAAGLKCIADAEATAWQLKKRLADVDSESDGPWSVRASVSYESDVRPPTAPFEPRYERLKRRWSYRHRCWSIDLTRVRSNVADQLDADEESLEVEIELVDKDMVFERPLRHVVEWGYKMVAEVCELMA